MLMVVAVGSVVEADGKAEVMPNAPNCLTAPRVLITVVPLQTPHGPYIARHEGN